MLIGNQFDSYTLWRPATRSDPVAIQWIPGEVPGASAADASLAPQAGKQVTTIVGAIGSKNGAGRVERAKRKLLERLDSTHYYLREGRLRVNCK